MGRSQVKLIDQMMDIHRINPPGQAWCFSRNTLSFRHRCQNITAWTIQHTNGLWNKTNKNSQSNYVRSQRMMFEYTPRNDEMMYMLINVKFASGKLVLRSSTREYSLLLNSWIALFVAHTSTCSSAGMQPIWPQSK